MSKPEMDASEVLDVLEHRYTREANGGTPRWAFIREVRVGTGFSLSYKGETAIEQRIDAWAMDCWRSGKYRQLSFEIKVSRSDFLAELKNPGKRAAAMRLSNEFYFVCPDNLIGVAEVPEGCGLMWVQPAGEVHKFGRLKTLITPPRTEAELPVRFIASALRKVTKLGIELKQLKGEIDYWRARATPTGG